MIRVYFDWNIISNLKKPEFKELKRFIEQNKEYLLFPYSPAHFSDLMKSYSPQNEFFKKDLETLEYLADKHLIRWGNKGKIEPLFCTPGEYFKIERDREDIFPLMDAEKVFQDLDDSANELGFGNIGSLMKSIFKIQSAGIEITEENAELLNKMFPNLKPGSSMWDLMKDVGPFSKKLLQDGNYYKDFRNSLSEKGFNLAPQAGNWSYDEVIKNIDEFLLSLGTKMTYLEYIESIFKIRKEPIDEFEYYISAYLMLDMIGYKKDKLPKSTDNMQNIQTDGEHSFYGAHCDLFVAMDKKLRIKSKVLYNEFSIPTKILKPDQLILELERMINPIPKMHDFVEEAVSFCKEDKIVEYYPVSDNNTVETIAYKLPELYFNFFNYVIYRNFPEQDGFVLTFTKVFKNFSRFIYYTESEKLIDIVAEYFGYDDMKEFELRKNEFVYGDKEIEFEWHFEGGIILLEKDKESKRPILSYFVSMKKEKSD